MPAHVSLVVLTLTWIFAMTARVRYRRGITRLSDPDLRRHVERWGRSRIPMLKDVMLVHERLARFQYYSRRETLEDDVRDA